MTTPSPAPQRLGATYPPYPFWAWTCSRNPEVAEDKGQWHRLTGPLPRGRSWPFYYWLPDQPEKPTCDPRTTPSPAPQQWAARKKEALDGIDYAMDWKNRRPSAVEFADGLATARQFIIDAAAISEENKQLRDRADRAEAWKDAVLNGWDVYQMLTDDMKKKTSAENVADTLDAVARCARRLIELRTAAHPAQGMEGRG